MFISNVFKMNFQGHVFVAALSVGTGISDEDC